MRRFLPLSLEDAAALDEQDRKNKTAQHQRGLRDPAHDKVWRWATAEELRLALPERQSIDTDGDHSPTTAELSSWAAYGMLPPGRGGRALTVRRVGDQDVFNIMAKLRAFEEQQLHRNRSWRPNFDWVPRPLALGDKYVLLFFSGHRRDWDIATWLQHLGPLIPVCIDLAIHPVWGNALQDSAWIRLIQARKVAAAHAAPPCETYTEARWLFLEDGQGPRPLRTAQHPWCLPECTEKEVRQCHVGPILFLQALKMLLLTWCHGGAITLEHPKGPDTAEERWSIWHSAFVRQWLLAADLQTITFVQGPLGQISWKPTTLLAGRLPHLAGQLYRAYQPHWRPSMVLGGRNADGTWRTSGAKAYPAEMCRVLATAYTDFAAAQNEEGTTPMPLDAAEAISQLMQWDPYLYFATAGRMAADYHRDAYVSAPF